MENTKLNAKEVAVLTKLNEKLFLTKIFPFTKDNKGRHCFFDAGDKKYVSVRDGLAIAVRLFYNKENIYDLSIEEANTYVKLLERLNLFVPAMY